MKDETLVYHSRENLSGRLSVVYGHGVPGNCSSYSPQAAVAVAAVSGVFVGGSGGTVAGTLIVVDLVTQEHKQITLFDFAFGSAIAMDNHHVWLYDTSNTKYRRYAYN